MLDNNQIWEDEEYILKIEKMGENFQALIFKKDGETLKFINIVIDPKSSKIERLINDMKLEISRKFITLKEV
ncbi:MAG: hypothetical protein PHF86_04310 [Candidatus Nanoarchaeia archaeon]|jgi:hypothetical protein|nr:hypothetical protein [Candidatus Nanoarchaeia archaeon]